MSLNAQNQDTDILSIRQNNILLFDFYGALLKDNQREVFTLHAVEDCSLAETAREMDATPQAIANTFKRALEQLNKYEEVLGLVAKFHTQKKTLTEVNSILTSENTTKNTNQENANKIEKIKILLENLL